VAAVSTVDLHLHTTYSDGTLTPTELVNLCARRGLRIIAITDHDITDGLPEALAAARAHPDLLLIPGVEISTDVPHNEVHVLGYFIDFHNRAFQERLSRFRRSRLERGRRMVEKLGELGMPIAWERVQEIAGEGSVARPHIAQAMVEAGYVASIAEAFERYIGRNGPAYVEREKMTPAEAVELIVRAGGLPVLAHPRDLEELDAYLEELKGVGLVGVEVYYQDYDEETIQRLLEAARRHRLLPLGGSDFHGLGGAQERLPGDIPLPEGPVQELLALARQPTAPRRRRW